MPLPGFTQLEDHAIISVG